jgi:hypothetical protein
MTNVVSIPIHDLDGRLLSFRLQFYGIPIQDFYSVPSPVVPKIRAALRRRGIDPDQVMISPFAIHALIY